MINFLQHKFKLDLRFFVKNNIFLSIGTVANIITGFILSLLFARLVVPLTFGKYTLIYSLIGIAGYSGLNGLRSILPFSVAQGKDGIYPRILKFTFLSSLLGSLFLVVVGMYYLLPGKPPLAATLLLVALIFPFINGLSLYPGLLTGKKKFFEQGMFAVLQAIIPNFFIATGILIFPENLFILLFSGLITQSILNIIFCIYTLSLVKSKIYEREDVVYGIKLSFIWMIPSITQYIDKILIVKLLGFESLAVYTFAVTIPQQFSNIFKNFQPLLIPKMGETDKDKVQTTVIKKSIMASLILSPVTLIYILFAPLLFQRLYPAYSASILPSQIYSLGFIFLPSIFITQLFHFFRQFRLISIFTVLSSCLYIFLLFVLITQVGIVGAVVASVLLLAIEYLLAVIMLKYRR